MINPTIEDVGILFADNGYITSDYGFMQYNNCFSAFDEVTDNEVLEIFKRVYPNFERRVLKVDMIKKYLPNISDKEFSIYDLCNQVVARKINKTKLNQEIQKLVKYNDDRKRELPEVIPGTDYDMCIQYLINNDIFTNCEILFRYTDNDFEVFGINHIKHLFKDVITDKMDTDNILRIIYIGLNELTYINDIEKDLDNIHLSNTLTKEDWQIYDKINEIINNIKEQSND